MAYSFASKCCRLQAKTCEKVSCRHLKYVAKEYARDPTRLFFAPETRSLLRTLTRADPNKVFRKRQSGKTKLEQPVYKFLTSAQLEDTLDEARNKVHLLLQMPPAVKVRQEIDKILSCDSALQGLEESKHVFADISFGTKSRSRSIVIREPCGTLEHADWDVRDRVNHLYFPKEGRKIKIPQMFEDDRLESLLSRGEYRFVLDRACVQFEPDHPTYQKVTSIAYQWIDHHSHFDLLRSTRHFGSLVFFLVWFEQIDNLLLDLIESDGGHLDEANCLIRLYKRVHDIVDLPPCKNETDLDPICTYIERFSTAKKSLLELALQARLLESQAATVANN